MIDCFTFTDDATEIKISKFKGENDVYEYNMFIRPKKYSKTTQQLNEIARSYDKVLHQLGIDEDTAVFRRFFCSDLTNQVDQLEGFALSSTKNICAVSHICQPPMPPARVSMWAYHISDVKSSDKIHDDNSLKLQRKNQAHHWTTNCNAFASESSYRQTQGIFSEYRSYIENNNLTLADNVVRTWFFVQNVDVNYKGFVEARNEIFNETGLTRDTHYIASTGIEGRGSNPQNNTIMDSYAISDVVDGQIDFLTAPEYLCPTHDYGVAFERATSVAYNDRKHVFLSGTASIDDKGEVVHKGDVLKQLERTVLNAEALLKQANGSLGDIASAIVYLRDVSDYEIIKENIGKYLNDTPHEIVLAPVCRPQWLVEIEAIAIVPNSDTEMPGF